MNRAVNPEMAWATALAVVAAAAPSMLAYNVPPSPTLLNQLLAMALWGWLLCAVAMRVDAGARLSSAVVAARGPLLVLGLLIGCAAVSSGLGSLPSGLALSAVGLMLAAAAMCLAGAASRGSSEATEWMVAFAWAWWVAGLFNAGVATVQVFLPDAPDGNWLARSGIPGRAVGNLRQPNHLSSLLLWSLAALVPLLHLRRIDFKLAAASAAGMVLAVVMSASRTGMVGVLLLAAWGGLDRRLARPTRGLLLAMPLLYLLSWALLAAWAHHTGHAFGAESRLAEADLSGSRFGIWRDTIALIVQEPWWGVGFGEFNFAWSLSVMPKRPIAFFDHTHNLPLQLAVEQGLPMAVLITALLLATLWRGWRRSTQALGDDAVCARTAWVMVLMMALHSLLEYPLWYAYFLLPTAWAWGYSLGAPGKSDMAPGRGWASAALLVAGLLTVLGAGFAVVDYSRVVAIYAPPEGAAPLDQRIATGRRSVLFAYHADYAAATEEGPSPERAGALRGAVHNLLDTRLMMSWADHLAAAGEVDKAKYIAQRLREFRNAASKDYFSACSATSPKTPAPYQCDAPATGLTWRAFLN